MSIENDELQHDRPTLHEQSLLHVPQIPGAMSGWLYATIARVKRKIRPSRLVAMSRNGSVMQKGYCRKGSRSGCGPLRLHVSAVGYEDPRPWCACLVGDV